MKRRVALGALALVSLLGTTACTAAGSEDGTGDASTSPSPSATPSPTAPVDLTLGVYGSKAEVEAYRTMANAWNGTSSDSQVTVRAWTSREQMQASLSQAAASGDRAAIPDVFLASRNELAFLREKRLSQPVDELLDERRVDFGDGYSRDAIEGFSADRQLQCMPYGSSPVVVYYNTQLVDFDAMAQRGLDVPSASRTKWSLDEFKAAAQYASRRGSGAKALAIEPTLEGLSPFIYAGGGEVYGDGTPPTSLAFSSDDSRGALEDVLPILRDPTLNLSQRQLAAADPISWFRRGKVAMILGTRALVPELREVKGLSFDVLPVPTIDTAATVGDVTGLCLSARTEHTVQAADFLAYAVSPEAVRLVTRTGYLVPANQQVALSDDFTQTTQQPIHGQVFTSAVRSMRLPPFLDDLPALQRAVARDVRALVTDPGDVDLDTLTTRIDEDSQAVLAPPSPTTSPSDSPSSSPSSSASG